MRWESRVARDAVLRVQTTVLLTVEQAREIEALRLAWGQPSTAAVIRRLVDEALTARDAGEAAAS